MTEQWQGDWMRDRETGQLIDGPALSRYEMFMLIRELRAVIRTHAKSIRDNDAVIEEQKARIGVLEGSVFEQHHAACQLAASVIRLDEQVRKLTEPKL